MERLPYNIWGYYWKEDCKNFNAYIPSLGLCLKYKDNTSWNKFNYNDYCFPSDKGAGTDCIGFVERTFSYRNTNESRDKNRIYIWDQLPADVAETNDYL